MYSIGGVAAKSSGRTSFLISFATILERYFGSLSSPLFMSTHLSLMGGFPVTLKHSSRANLRPYVHGSHRCEFFGPGFLHQLFLQFTACGVIPVFFPPGIFELHVANLVLSVIAFDAFKAALINQNRVGGASAATTRSTNRSYILRFFAWLTNNGLMKCQAACRVCRNAMLNAYRHLSNQLRNSG